MLGFTTGSGEGEYSVEMMEELHQTLTNSGLTAPVTIPLRAALAARQSWSTDCSGPGFT